MHGYVETKPNQYSEFLWGTAGGKSIGREPTDQTFEVLLKEPKEPKVAERNKNRPPLVVYQMQAVFFSLFLPGKACLDLGEQHV